MAPEFLPLETKSMPDLSLYVDSLYTSPFAMPVYVALSEMGLDFELETVDIERGEQHRSPFREQSGTGRIPALRHGDFWLSESSAICEYLHDEFAAVSILIYPAGVRERARARQVQAWLRSDLAALRQDRPTDIIFRAEKRAAMTDAGRKAADKLLSFAATLIGDRETLFAEWCIADTELALMLNRLVMNGDPVPETLTRYAGQEWQRPSIQAWCALARGEAQAP
jgi:glutathione S-transferase